jgi:hypothetical protein
MDSKSTACNRAVKSCGAQHEQFTSKPCRHFQGLVRVRSGISISKIQTYNGFDFLLEPLPDGCNALHFSPPLPFGFKLGVGLEGFLPPALDDCPAFFVGMA